MQDKVLDFIVFFGQSIVFFFLIMKIAGYKLTLSGAGLLRQRGLRFESGISRKKLTRTS